MEKKIEYEYHQCGANEKSMDIHEKRDKGPNSLRLVEKRQEHAKYGTLRFKFDSNLNQKVSVPRKPDRRRRDEGTTFDLELSLQNNEKSRWGSCYFESNEPRTSTSTEMNRQKPAENVSSTEENEVVRPTANFSIVAVKNIYYI